MEVRVGLFYTILLGGTLPRLGVQSIIYVGINQMIPQMLAH